MGDRSSISSAVDSSSIVGLDDAADDAVGAVGDVNALFDSFVEFGRLESVSEDDITMTMTMTGLGTNARMGCGSYDLAATFSSRIDRFRCE